MLKAATIKGFKVLTGVLTFVAVFGFQAFSNTEQSENHAETTAKHSESEKFKPGDMILDHIKDSYGWHVADIGGHPIAIPLPVILYTNDHGLVVFSSSALNHGHSAYSVDELTHYALKDGHVVNFRSPEADFDYKNIHNIKDGITREQSVAALFSGVPGSFVDISITKNVFSLLLAVTLLLVVFLSVAKSYVANPGKAPKGLQSFMEPLILFVRDEVAKPSIGHDYKRFMPYLLTLFFFIWFNNMMGLIPVFPFGANVTGNIAVTLVLAVFTFVLTHINAKGTYWKHIFLPDVPAWLYPLMIPIEIIGVVVKPVVLTLRLFANITAGHIIVLAFFSLIFIFGAMAPVAGYGVSIVSVAFTIFMNFMELLVAFLQAYVFTLLSAIYIGMAVEEHH
jgi:F-type H+-transporting ATPase subunit a